MKNETVLADNNFTISFVNGQITNLADNNFTISFVNGQITNVTGIGHIPAGITNNFTGKLIYKNSELLEVNGSGELNNVAFNNAMP
jgi:hypothetical protein